MKSKKWPRRLKLGLIFMGIYFLFMTAAFIYLRISLNSVPHYETYKLPEYVWLVSDIYMFPTMSWLMWLGMFHEMLRLPDIPSMWFGIIAHFLNGLLLFAIGTGVPYRNR